VEPVAKRDQLLHRSVVHVEGHANEAAPQAFDRSIMLRLTHVARRYGRLEPQMPLVRHQADQLVISAPPTRLKFRAFT
jgi:hypothetical protein